LQNWRGCFVDKERRLLLSEKNIRRKVTPMRHMNLLSAVLALIFPCLPGYSEAAESEAELVERGRYILTAIEGCGCHTREDKNGHKDKQWHFAGAPEKPPPAGSPANVGWTTPGYEKIYASNITPDPETGIGKWTEADFLLAMRSGLTPNRRVLDPQMPWNAFQGITDRDLKSMWAYLKTIKPIKNKVPDSIPVKK
jgi:hypothetical protein